MVVGRKCVCACRKLLNDPKLLRDQQLSRIAESPEFLTERAWFVARFKSYNCETFFLLDASIAPSNLIETNVDHYE